MIGLDFNISESNNNIYIRLISDTEVHNIKLIKDKCIIT